jgi:maleylacetate reductase
MNPFETKFELTERNHRVVFGRPVAEVLGDELNNGTLGRHFVISTPGMFLRFAALAVNDARLLGVGFFPDAVPHVPQSVAQRAAEKVRDSGAQTLVAFGGGSALDTAKAVAHDLHLDILAIPTNFSGSEVTWNFGRTSDGVKRTVLDPNVLPRTVVYDPLLLDGLSEMQAVCSGINAIAHAVEGLYAVNANPLTNATALSGITHLIRGLPLRRQSPTWQANAQCMLGAWLCGEVLSKVGMGLHHRICHVLGGTFGLPHAAAHTVMLPYSIEFNETHAPQLESLRGLVEGLSPGLGIATFTRGLGAPGDLQTLGFRASDIARATELTLATPVVNPRTVRPEDVERILLKALRGAPLGC